MIDKRKKPPYQPAPLLDGDALEDIEVENMYWISMWADSTYILEIRSYYVMNTIIQSTILFYVSMNPDPY